MLGTKEDYPQPCSTSTVKGKFFDFRDGFKDFCEPIQKLIQNEDYKKSSPEQLYVMLIKNLDNEIDVSGPATTH